MLVSFEYNSSYIIFRLAVLVHAFYIFLNMLRTALLTLSPLMLFFNLENKLTSILYHHMDNALFG